MKHSLCTAIAGLILGTAMAQPDLPAQEYFDFWVGEWELTWEDPDGFVASGANVITKEYDDFVIYERFNASTGALQGFEGMSVSVYNPNLDVWKQTWVDNQGSYLDLTGRFEGDRRMFFRSANGPDGQKVLQRMVFYDITQNQFMWDWESSTDEGKTWNLNWRITYSRKK